MRERPEAGLRLKPDVDLDAAITEVVEAGGRLVKRGEHAPGAPYAYVVDPDGYLIELWSIGEADPVDRSRLRGCHQLPALGGPYGSFTATPRGGQMVQDTARSRRAASRLA